MIVSVVIAASLEYQILVLYPLVLTPLEVAYRASIYNTNS